MTVKKSVLLIHRWLGLISGLVVFIVAITGCIYAFKEEIQSFTEEYRYIENPPANNRFHPPSELRVVADSSLPGKHIHSILYHTSPERAAKAIYFENTKDEKYYNFVYINPYTGKVLKIKDVYADFFRIVLDGHYYLWLPPEIGQPVVASSTLIFLLMLLSGIFLWWPKKRKFKKQHFSIKWKGRWRRKNYDLHRVFGFYACFIGIVLAITGLVWGFEWFRDAYYATASGGDVFKEYKEPPSDTTAAKNAYPTPVDRVLKKVKRERKDAETIEIHFPVTEASPVLAAVNPDRSTYWKIDYLFYDQYTLRELPVDHMWGKLSEADHALMLMRMNYDIHVGAILGLPGKILMFFVSLVIASLPVTGVLMWYGRKYK